MVAYELLVGARPYRLKRRAPAELEEAITSIDPPLASEAAREPALRKQLKGDLDAILNKALKKDSSQRYATVEALAQDLRRHLDHQPVLAQPDRLRYRAGKFVSRHRFPGGGRRRRGAGTSGGRRRGALAGATRARTGGARRRGQALRVVHLRER